MLGLVTAEVARTIDPDLAPFEDACRRAFGADEVDVVAWDDPDVDWSSFDAAIVRSTWDYTTRLPEFLEWLHRVSGATRLLNDPAAVRWSTDKIYLRDLADAGVPITPTTFVAPGESAPRTDELSVVKPSIGAGSVGARRCTPDEVADHVAHLHGEGRTAMVQPYLHRLDDLGETSLCFVPGAHGGLELSHAFRKAAILRSLDVEQVGGLFAKEEISTRVPSAAELDLAERILATPIVSCFDLAFARLDIAPVDGAHGGEHGVAVMEVELIEPSFYFDTSPGSADRFAHRLADELDRTATVRTT